MWGCGCCCCWLRAAHYSHTQSCRDRVVEWVRAWMGRNTNLIIERHSLMQNITIGRYKPAQVHANIECFDGKPPAVVDVADLFDGWIEGIRDDGSSWIMWLDSKGNPYVFYPNRDETGGVIGDGIRLGDNNDDSLDDD
ncbi:hypothetical protein PBI_CHE9D_41 [Mycobacterium phage Che9d]|uniref:Uncharacterized protein n=1 Tax=Mycobacterium phage Che9d TaxID=2907834 RepID=Q855S2_9CAUD|nr:hypothetical protein PBI_CHE9D_41 [Mycobacterium phage Che9d]AAN07959.1 hypothetical protein PBI_CHE9D_41 [Mycobacterium phage Che9d]